MFCDGSADRLDLRMLGRIEDRPVVMKGLMAGGDGGLRRDHDHAHVVQDVPKMIEPVARSRREPFVRMMESLRAGS